MKKNKAAFIIWDLPTRIFHWALVGLVITSFVTADIGGNAMQYHVWSGYAILALLLFRLAWGFIGSTTSRFTSFVRGPTVAWRYFRDSIRENRPHLGHNPLGGWSILAMLLALLVQVGTGLFATDDIVTQGPLYPLVSEATSRRLTAIHLINQGVIVGLVCLHIAAVFYYLWFKRDNLILSMITGRKARQDSSDEKKLSIAPTWVALAIFALCAGAVYVLVR